MYEIKIDTDGDAVADIAYQVRFSPFQGGAQTATLRRTDGAQAAGTDEGGQVTVERAPVSTGREVRITKASEYRFFAGWRSDPFFCDVEGAKNNLRLTGDDFFADKDVCSIVCPVAITNSLCVNRVRVSRVLNTRESARLVTCSGGHPRLHRLSMRINPTDPLYLVGREVS